MKSIVLGADYAYADKVLTTIKSICSHNNHLKIYLFNQDFPVEWVRWVNEHLAQMGSQLIDIKFDNDRIKEYPTNNHINYAAFFRYFIPEFVEEDLCLYLDADIIVRDDISELFTIDLKTDGYAFAGCKDLGVQNEGEDGDGFEVNTGVMLINNQYWREHGILEQLLEASSKLGTEIQNGDQGVINYLLKDKALLLDEEVYNYQLGYHYFSHYNQQKKKEVFENFDEKSHKILHYIHYDKPWNYFSGGIGREIWWRYFQLEWGQIVAKWQIEEPQRLVATPMQKIQKSALIYTPMAEMEQLEYLVASLPQYHFHVAAQTPMYITLRQLVKYPNITLHPGALPETIRQLTHLCDVYLDITYGDEIDGILGKMTQLGKPIFAFDNTSHGEGRIFPHTEASQLVEALESYAIQRKG